MSFSMAAREEYDHYWVWYERTSRTQGYWKSSKSDLVMVFPPSEEVGKWQIFVDGKEKQSLVGDDAEERAFSVAALFADQNTSVNFYSEMTEAKAIDMKNEQMPVLELIEALGVKPSKGEKVLGTDILMACLHLENNGKFWSHPKLERLRLINFASLALGTRLNL